MKADDLHPFVARERELAWLDEQLQLALQGRGRVCFITGEAGSGKTALVSAFARRAQESSADLVVGIGECNAQTGVGDPYLPFREMLRLLTGDADADQTHPAATTENTTRLNRFLRASGEALVESGPDLVGIFIPGGSLLARLGAKLVGRSPGAARLRSLLPGKPDTPPAGDVPGQVVGDAKGDGEADSARVAAPDVEALQQSQVFEQYTNVVRGMASTFPLLLLLDDLHWADEASLGLLFHLGRRIEDSRILVVGSYRPSDTKAGRQSERHPLVPVVNELQRHYGNVRLELASEDPVQQQGLVDALIDASPNRLDGAFREALWDRTQGHPLFVVELLRHLQATGGLIQDDDGAWVTGPEIRWDALPARAEGIIAERVDRLPAELRELLAVASVEGEQFTAEVLAAVRGLDPRAVVRQLSGELEARHDLVVAQGVARIADRRVSSYRFRHNLFHEYLYGSLDDAERSYLHEDVGLALEHLYGDRADEIAVQLGRHFEEAGDPERAVRFRLLAARRAQEQHANAEAILHFRRTLELLDGLTAAEEVEEIRRVAREGLGDVLALTGRADEARSQFAEALSGQEAGDRVGGARLRRKVGDAWISQHNAEEALRSYDDGASLLEDGTGPVGPEHAPEWLQLQLQRMWSLYFLGEDLEEPAARVRPILESHGSAAQRARFSQYLAMGRLRASRYVVSDDILALALAGQEASRASGQLGSLAMSHYLLGACRLHELDGAAAEEHLVESLRLSRRTGAATQALPALAWLAVAYRLQGRLDDVRNTATEGAALSREMGNDTYLTVATSNLAWVAWREGRPEEARNLAHDALSRTVPLFPFRWLAEWLLMRVACRDGRWLEAVEHARRMLHPPQQQQPPLLHGPLTEAVGLWDDGEQAAARASLEGLVPAAVATGRL